MEALYARVLPHVRGRNGKFRRPFVWERRVRVDGVAVPNEPCPRRVVPEADAGFCHWQLGHAVSITEVGGRTVFEHNTYTVHAGEVVYNSRLRAYVDEEERIRTQYVLVNTFGLSGLTNFGTREGELYMRDMLREMAGS